MDQEVESLLDKLRYLRLQQGRLMTVLEEEWEDMEKNLGEVKAFLKDSNRKSYYSKTYQELALHIYNCLYDMEDIIDDCEIQITTYNNSNINLLHLTQILDSIRHQIQTYNDAIGDFPTTNVQLLRSLQEPPPISEGNLVMGLEEETKSLIGYLHEENEKLDVITIVGMRGIGKTTLAWKTFNSDEAVDKFPTRIWINVSNEFNMKEVFLAILERCMSLTKDDIDFIDGIDDVSLARVVAIILQSKMFLIVMDDVCSAYDWDRLRIALPHSTNKGKVLITSRNEDVDGHANRTRLPLKVGFLTCDESWSLLRSQVFPDIECPPELEYIGQVIASQCGGLPLAIMSMAFTLLEEDLSSSNMKERRISWTKVSSRVPQILYRSLPFETRHCFLYFGMFPEGYDIPVRKLISMWIAEGIVQQPGSMSLEETAETYLEDLISRNLVITSRIKSSGKTKTCRIHPMMYEFCRIEAGKSKFLQEIELSDGGDFDPPIPDLWSYRLSISSKVLDFLSSKPFGLHVRSFVCSSCDEFNLPAQYSSVIPAGFKLLTILDVMPVRLTKITSDMYQLVHVKFLALSILDLKILPAELCKLRNIQTLVVHTTSRTLDIRAEIWQFTQLKHLKTNASATLVMTGDYDKKVENLQTLAMVSPESCTKELFLRAHNLKKLGIRGKLSSFGTDNKEVYWLKSLSSLENLKLVNDAYPFLASSGKLHSLPASSICPRRLRSLTLAQTYLDWSQMCALGQLERLEVLKLKEHAFIGPNWVTEAGGFENLQVLHIEHTDLVTWVSSATHFPWLRRLILKRCEKLQAVPIELADIPTLQYLEMYITTHAVVSAIMIREKIKINRYQEGPSRNIEFELSIYPPTK